MALDIPQASLYTPTENDIEYGDKLLQHNKLAKLASYNVRIFNMSDKNDVEEYQKLMQDLFEKIQTKRCIIWAKDRSLIDGTWKIYMEWSIYSIGSEDKEKSESAKQE